MNVLIEKLKISNFLSFLGEYEVNLKPFSAIMCNFHEGKDDLLRVFEFVFGANLEDLRTGNPLDLVHSVLREEFLINRNIQSYVEVTLCLLHEKKQVKLHRSVKNGANSARIEHKISGLITSSHLYKEELISLGVYIKEKNLIFYKNYFDSALWGSAEELEMVICNCLRESYLLDDWKAAKKEVEYLTKLKNRAAEKNYNAMKRCHSIIERYADKYRAFCANREKASGRILRDLTIDSLSDSTTSEVDSSRTEENEMKKEKISSLEVKLHFRTEELDHLKLREVCLISRLYHEEIKLATKPVNASILQNRISHLKVKIQEKENNISEVWKEIQTVKSELDGLSQKISFTLIALRNFQISNYRQNRFTRYGRLYDYVQYSPYVKLLKQIIGADIFYSHLCDSVEDAFSIMKQLRNLKHENREVFLPFENYPPKLKDVITASGERGIRLNTIEELLIFLCKMKHYNVIEEVPVIVKKHFNFDNVLPEGNTIYYYNNIYFTNEGLICRRGDENDFTLGTEKELQENLIQLFAEEELKYRKWKDLLHLKWETLVDMNTIENDIFYFKQKWRKYTQKPHVVRESSPLLEIYEEYREIFTQHTEEREKYESELQQEEEPLFEEINSSTSSNGDPLNVILKELDEVTTQKITIRKQLEDMTRELHLLNIIPAHAYPVEKKLIQFRNNNSDEKEFFFEKEFKMLTDLIKEDDLEDLCGLQEWRKHFIASLLKEVEGIKNRLKSSIEGLQNIATARKRKLYQLFDHCSRNLSSTFSHILDDALPFVKIDFGSGEEEIHILSSLGEEKINVVDIKHFNSLLKFLSVLSVFLEIAKFNKIPFMIVDDTEEYFPHHNDDLSAVLDSNNLKKLLPDTENQRFHLLMRVGQFLKHFIRKNTAGKLIRNHGSQTDCRGPIQIIYFTKEDFVHAAEHTIWIQNQILSEEYITENCNSYSEIHEIIFEGTNDH